MASISSDQFDYLFDRENTGPEILEGPVRYDVWRTYGLRGRQFRANLILARPDLPDAVGGDQLVELLRAISEADSPTHTSHASAAENTPFAVAAGERTRARANLAEMVRRVLPFTVWHKALDDLARAGDRLVEYLSPDAPPDPTLS